MIKYHKKLKNTLNKEFSGSKKLIINAMDKLNKLEEIFKKINVDNFEEYKKDIIFLLLDCSLDIHFAYNYIFLYLSQEFGE